MDLHISENIHAYRKQRNMMQEQFVSAVSKWERGAAVPDLAYLWTAFLGYELNRSGLAATLNKIQRCSKENLFEEGNAPPEQAEKQYFYSLYTVSQSCSIRCGKNRSGFSVILLLFLFVILSIFLETYRRPAAGKILHHMI